MSAQTPGWRRPPAITTARLTVALVLAMLVAPPLLFSLVRTGSSWVMLGYLAFAVVTAWTLRSVRREAGSWLGRRAVRRGVVVALAATCAGMVATKGLAPAPAAGAFSFLVVALVLLNVALGWATLRMASAPDAAVDERQEALRNRAHRIAYWTFAGLVGGTLAIAQVASPLTRSWVAGALTSGGAGVAFGELLFVLPGMVLAWLEPDHLAPESAAPGLSGRARLALGMLALAIAWPTLLSVGMVALPARTTSTVTPLAARAGRCEELMAVSQVGLGVEASIPVHATACGDGRTASQGWGLNHSDCQIASGTFVTITPSRCGRTVDADGTLRFTYGAMVRPSLLPFLGREVVMRVVVDRDGRVVRFP